MKSWAEAVLADEEEPGPAPSRVEAPEPAPPPLMGAVRAPPAGGAAARGMAAGGDSGPPAHWLRDIEARGGGPPADWVTRVRQGAPSLLDRRVHEGRVAPDAGQVAPLPAQAPVKESRPAPPRAPTASAREAHGPWGEAPTSRLRTPSPLPGVDAGAAEPGRHPSWSAGVDPGAPGTVRPASWSAGLEPPLPPPGTRPRPSRHTVPRGPPGSETRALPPREGPSPAPGLPVSFLEDRSSEDGAPPRTPAPDSRVVYLPPREILAPRRPERPPTFPGPRVQVLSIEGEPVGVREPRPHASDEDRGAGARRVREPVAEAAPVEAPAPHPWPELPPAVAPSAEASVWPELLPAPAGEPTGALVELREWERLRRLEREQRGE